MWGVGRGVFSVFLHPSRFPLSRTPFLWSRYLYNGPRHAREVMDDLTCHARHRTVIPNCSEPVDLASLLDSSSSTATADSTKPADGVQSTSSAESTSSVDDVDHKDSTAPSLPRVCSEPDPLDPDLPPLIALLCGTSPS